MKSIRCLIFLLCTINLSLLCISCDEIAKKLGYEKINSDNSTNSNQSSDSAQIEDLTNKSKSSNSYQSSNSNQIENLSNSSKPTNSNHSSNHNQINNLPSKNKITSPSITRSFSVNARVFHFVGTIYDGYEKATDQYEIRNIQVYPNGEIYSDGLPVRFSMTQGYDYECNRGNIIYKFNSQEIDKII